MPVEGHWERANTPLRARDRRVLLVVAAVAVVALVVLGVAYALRPAARSDAGCLVANVPSTMGGATVRSCGSQAHELCRTQGKIDRAIAEACISQGFAADVPRAPSG
jgi:hypothetical protein